MNPQILPNIFIKGMVLCLIYLLHNPVLTIKIIYFTPGMESRAHLFIPGVEGIELNQRKLIPSKSLVVVCWSSLL